MNKYEILGIERDADKSRIQKGYKKALKKIQKKANSGDKEAKKKLKSLKEAYATLNDNTKKKKYDAELNSASIAATENPSAINENKPKDKTLKTTKKQIKTKANKSSKSIRTKSSFFERKLDMESVITLCILIGFIIYFAISAS